MAGGEQRPVAGKSGGKFIRLAGMRPGCCLPHGERGRAAGSWEAMVEEQRQAEWAEAVERAEKEPVRGVAGAKTTEAGVGQLFEIFYQIFDFIFISSVLFFLYISPFWFAIVSPLVRH